jgi:hypothetical protein
MTEMKFRVIVRKGELGQPDVSETSCSETIKVLIDHAKKKGYAYWFYTMVGNSWELKEAGSTDQARNDIVYLQGGESLLLHVNEVLGVDEIKACPMIYSKYSLPLSPVVEYEASGLLGMFKRSKPTKQELAIQTIQEALRLPDFAWATMIGRQKFGDKVFIDFEIEGGKMLSEVLADQGYATKVPYVI